MHPYPGNWVAIGRAVVYYVWASHAFNAGINCRHCTSIYCRSDCEYSPDDVQSSGRVYVYNVPSKVPRHVLTGDGYFGQFGMSLDVGNPYVPGFDMLAIGGTALSRLIIFDTESSLLRV